MTQYLEVRDVMRHILPRATEGSLQASSSRLQHNRLRIDGLARLLLSKNGDEATASQPATSRDALVRAILASPIRTSKITLT